jgi:hypothetical protein
MRARPGSTDQLFVDWGATGATLGVRVDDLEGNTTIARAIGFVEIADVPGLYYLDPFTFPEDAGSYVLIFDDDGGTYALGHTATDELTISSSAPDDVVSGDAYVTVEELFRILKIQNPSVERTIAGERVLAAAAFEIDSFIDLADGDSLSGRPLALAQEVNLERAVEHWRQQEAAFGLIPLEGLAGGVERTARDGFERHRAKLSPAKAQWGIA